jgi:hypothetical protein
MGATEEVGKAVSGVVDAMRATPFLLALLILNIVFIGLTIYVLHEVAVTVRDRGKEQTELLRNCMDRRSDNKSPLFRDTSTSIIGKTTP